MPGMVRNCLVLILPMPAIAVPQSYYQGTTLNSRRTRSIPDSVGLFLFVSAVILLAGMLWGVVTGLYVALGAFTLGEFLRTFWLWLRSQEVHRHPQEWESAPIDLSPTTSRG